MVIYNANWELAKDGKNEVTWLWRHPPKYVVQMHQNDTTYDL